MYSVSQVPHNARIRCELLGPNDGDDGGGGSADGDFDARRQAHRIGPHLGGGRRGRGRRLDRINRRPIRGRGGWFNSFHRPPVFVFILRLMVILGVSALLYSGWVALFPGADDTVTGDTIPDDASEQQSTPGEGAAGDDFPASWWNHSFGHIWEEWSTSPVLLHEGLPAYEQTVRDTWGFHLLHAASQHAPRNMTPIQHDSYPTYRVNKPFENTH